MRKERNNFTIIEVVLYNDLRESANQICVCNPKELVKLQLEFLVIIYKSKIHLINITHIELKIYPHNKLKFK